MCLCVLVFYKQKFCDIKILSSVDFDTGVFDFHIGVLLM